MLQRLIIENIALIERLELEFFGGFNVLTGETGAGKSIIIDSLGLVLGERANRELISYGCSKAKVEAFFSTDNCHAVHEYLEQNEIELEDGEVTISREIYASGKNVCRLNGVLVNANTLREITSLLVDIHGQHEHQSLLSPASQAHYLDAYAGVRVESAKHDVFKAYSEYVRVKAELEAGFMPENERAQRIDILSFQLKEIDNCALVPGEDGELEEEQRILSNSEHIMMALERCCALLNGDDSGALSGVKSASDSMCAIAEFSPKYAEAAQKLEESYYALEDAAYVVRDMRTSFEYDPERLDYIGGRLYQIAGLKRKYGATIEEILQFRDKCAAELEKLTSADEVRMRLEGELKACIEHYKECARALTELRREAAKTLTDEVIGQLSELSLKNSDFSVEILSSDDISPNGSDKIEFYITTNKGEPLKPLNKVASGGEMSRIMLALKTIIAGKDDIGTLIFDEIDTGISGRVSSVVGEKMVRTSMEHQVICITHSPQIAAFADNHLVVEKREESNKTHTFVRAISGAERASELARIMGSGTITESAERHAKELIDDCEAIKKRIRLGQ